MIRFYILIHLQRPGRMQHCLIKHYDIHYFFPVESRRIEYVCLNKIASFSVLNDKVHVIGVRTGFAQFIRPLKS